MNFTSGMAICRRALTSRNICHFTRMIFSNRKPFLYETALTFLRTKIKHDETSAIRNVVLILAFLVTTGLTITYFDFLRLSNRCMTDTTKVTLPENCTIQGPTRSTYPHCCPEAVCMTRYPWQLGDIYKVFMSSLP